MTQKCACRSGFGCVRSLSSRSLNGREFPLRCLKFLKKQDTATQKRLVTAIGKLPAEGDIKNLQGVDGYRLRMFLELRKLHSNGAILGYQLGAKYLLTPTSFDINGIIIDIIDIGNRGQIYKGV